MSLKKRELRSGYFRSLQASKCLEYCIDALYLCENTFEESNKYKEECIKLGKELFNILENRLWTLENRLFARCDTQYQDFVKQTALKKELSNPRMSIDKFFDSGTINRKRINDEDILKIRTFIGNE